MIALDYYANRHRKKENNHRKLYKYGEIKV